MKKLVGPYILLVGLPLLALAGILKIGSGIVAPAITESVRAFAANHSIAPLDLGQLVLQICVILGASRITGMLFKKIHQPQVIGEMVAGILLGPSLLGWLAPDVSAHLFPVGSPHLSERAEPDWAGALMFVVGVACRSIPTT